MKLLEQNKQLTHYCAVLRAEARKIHREYGASPPYEEVLDRFEDALRREGVPYSCGVWLPDKIGAFYMNCGVFVDLVVGDRFAVLVDADRSASRKLEEEARRCFERRDFSGVILVRFDEEPCCRRLTRRASLGASGERTRDTEKCDRKAS